MVPKTCSDQETFKHVFADKQLRKSEAQTESGAEKCTQSFLQYPVDPLDIGPFRHIFALDRKQICVKRIFSKFDILHSFHTFMGILYSGQFGGSDKRTQKPEEHV